MSETPSPLTKAGTDPNPIRQFEKWYHDVMSSGIADADAMTLATTRMNGEPSARVVLLKDFDDSGFVFYTNYESRKGQDLGENPRACLLFYWSSLWRQVRIEGTVEKVSAEESEQYFHSRPLGSKIGAWASDQSRPIASRAELEKKFDEIGLEFGDNVPRPPHWGGYRLKPNAIEFWQGRENRLHDRLLYSLQQDGSWLIERLGP